MKVVVAPDSFKESMTAAQAAASMSAGVHTVFPDADCVEIPMADGGEGTVDALISVLDGSWHAVSTVDALGRPIEAGYGLTPDGLVIIEVASAVGLGQISPDQRDIRRASSIGVADLIGDALDAGATRFIIGLGGSATTDCGAGMLAGLGVTFLAADGTELTPTPSALAELDHADLNGLDPRLADVRIELACDVSNPLLGEDGAAAVFGPQKGATPEDVVYLDRILEKVADALTAAGAPDVRDHAGAGAAGGLGAGFLAIGARMRRGAEVVADAARLAEAVDGADLVLTGEGGVDFQTLSGKTPAGVAEVAARFGLPVIAFAGTIGRGADDLVGNGFEAVVPIMPGPGSLTDALANGPENLERAVATAMRLLRLGASSGLAGQS